MTVSEYTDRHEFKHRWSWNALRNLEPAGGPRSDVLRCEILRPGGHWRPGFVAERDVVADDGVRAGPEYAIDLKSGKPRLDGQGQPIPL